MAHIVYREAKGGAGFALVFALFVLMLLGALAAALYMEEHGHIVSGMSNGIVWGLPHVFAIFLIVTASGILNMASVASVFGKLEYKPQARLSALMAIACLAGGLGVLVLDLGRPERLTVAMTSYNFRSIFAWNIFLYTGFIFLVGAYLIVQMTRRWEHHTPKVGLAAFLWRLILTTGTGSIFGWLVARQAYNSAVMAPLFIAMSLSFGLAVFLLARMWLDRGDRRELGAPQIRRLAKLLGLFAAAVIYFTGVMHLTNLYSAARVPVEHFLLFTGGVYPLLFWGGQMLLGGIVPIAILFSGLNRSGRHVALAAMLVVIGGLAQVYVIVIGGQAFPLLLFPGWDATSSFGDGQIQSYVPALPELMLGLGGIAIAALVTMVGVKVLPILPQAGIEQAIESEPAVEGLRAAA